MNQEITCWNLLLKLKFRVKYSAVLHFKPQGSEFSFQLFQPGTETGFLHTHKTHEELYFFLSGNGEFQVDGQVFPISEGSVVRVVPEGKRSIRNNGTEPLVMLCIQYKSNTFNSEDAADGNILGEPVKW